MSIKIVHQIHSIMFFPLKSLELYLTLIKLNSLRELIDFFYAMIY